MERSSLSDAERAQLDRGLELLRPIRRSAKVASISLWTVGIFGALSALWGLASGFSGIVVGLALLAVAWNEWRGRSRLRALDPAGPRILGWNQVVLAAVVTIYCVAAIWRARTAPPNPALVELEEMAGVSPEVVADLTTYFYVVVIAVVGGVQAITARFHFKRRATLETFLRETPEWVREVLEVAPS